MTLIDTYLAEITGTLSDKTVQDRTRHLRALDLWMAKAGKKEFNRQLVADFIRYLQITHTGKASVALHKSSVSAFYTWLVENEHIHKNPVPDIPAGRYRSKTKPDECAFTEDEYGKVKEACRNQKIRFGYWEGAVIVGWNTGLRLGDIACLEWSEINFIERMLVIIPNKTRRFEKRLEIPMTNELFDYLSGKFQERVSGHVFPSMFSQYQADGAKHLSQQFTRICIAAGITGKSFHGLRHAVTSRLLNAGTPISVVSSITGHTLGVLNRYSHVPADEKRKALQAL